MVPLLYVHACVCMNDVMCGHCCVSRATSRMWRDVGGEATCVPSEQQLGSAGEGGYCGSTHPGVIWGCGMGRGRPVARSGNGGRGVNNKCGPNYWVVGVVGCLIRKVGGGEGRRVLYVY